MKKVVVRLISAILITILLIGIIFFIVKKHNNVKEDTKQSNIISTQIINENKYVPLEQLPENYSFEQALQDECFIITYKQVYNIEKLETFIKNNQINNKNRISDTIRIVQYTVEGDMIITDVAYKNEENKYIVTKDNRRDKFSSKEDREITCNDNFPGKFYGIVQKEEGEYVKIELALYAEIDYIEGTKPYENYEIVSIQRKNYGPTFTATVMEIRGKVVLAQGENGEYDKYSFKIPEGQELNLKIGDEIIVTYTGIIQDTYPMGITVLKIEKK